MDNYFFVDGSALLADLSRFRAKHSQFQHSKFRIQRMAKHFTGPDLEKYHSRTYRRFSFYFVSGDPRIKRDLEIPDPRKPEAVEDMSVIHCGKRIRHHARAEKWLDAKNAPDYVRACFHKAEKAVDTRICCDALQLAAQGKLDRLFLYTNDLDFLPLCTTLKAFGANINLIRITSKSVNKELAEECDGFNDMPDEVLMRCFE